MLKSFFIWAFIVLPLAIAVAVMLYQARRFFLGVAAVAAAMALIWGVLSVAASIDRWLEEPPDAAASDLCVEAPSSESCAL